MSKLPHSKYYFHEDFVNYENFTGNSHDALVMFYAPWCGHCQTAKPEFEKAFGGIATDYDDYLNQDSPKLHDNKLALIKVNGDDHPDLASKLNVSGFPTFKYIKNVQGKSLDGEASDYNNSRTASALEDFAKNKMGGEEHFSNYEQFEDYKLDYDYENDNSLFN